MSDAVGAEGAQAPERRHLTMLFSDLTESTRIAGSMENEDYAELLGRLRAFYSSTIPRHGGTIVQIQGDGVLAVFGYPVPDEHNARQATEAALELHAQVKGLRDDPAYAGMELSLHTGIHGGLVLFIPGDQVRGRFELLGNATNLASRLSDAAEAEEILVSEETLGPEIALFVTSAPRPLMLKSRAQPLSTVRVLGRAQVASRYEGRARRGLSPFVGREDEMRRLHAHVEAALAGRQQHVAIAGAPGMGKTRLAEEFLLRVAPLGFQVHRGYCESYLSAEPLQPFMQILRSLLGFERDHAAAAVVQRLEHLLAGLDPALLPERVDLFGTLSLALGGADTGAPPPPASRMVAALRSLLQALAVRQPTLLFIDDWQWADDLSRQVLGAVRELDAVALFVLLSTRGVESGDARMSGIDILDLPPFSDREAVVTVARLLPAASPFDARELARYAGGNPLILEELCHSAAHGRQQRAPAPDGMAWLNTLIESRVARLPARQLEIARTAAVIGNVVPCWLLERLTGCGESDPLVASLAAEDVVFPAEIPGALRFKHGIARDVIYNTVSLRDRKALHLRIAGLIEQEVLAAGLQEAHEQLAYHYGAAGSAADAARHAELAGDRALSVSALDRAQTQYRAALAALDQLPARDEHYARWMQVMQRLATACVFDPSPDQLAIFRRARELASSRGDTLGVGYAEFWRGYVEYALGDSRQSIEHLESALACAREVGDAGLQARSKAALGQARAAACDYPQALPLLEEAVANRRHRDRGAQAAVGYGYTMACRGTVLGDLGRFEEAHATFREALAAVAGARHEVESSILCLRSLVYVWQARWDEARAAALESQRVAERVKSLYQYARSITQLGHIGWAQRRDPSALATLVEAASWLHARDQSLFISLSYGWIAEALVESGRAQEARSYAARAFARARRSDRFGEAVAYRAMARAAVAADPAAADRYLRQAFASASFRASPHEMALTRMCEGEIALQRGRRDVGVSLLEQAAEAFEAMQVSWHAGRARDLARR